MEKHFDRIILGIDPGTQVMGYGLIGIRTSKPELITLGVIRMAKTEDHFLRIRKIFEGTVSLIDEHHPDELSIEAPFFGKNVQSMLKLGRAQGVAMAAALSRQLPVYEYSPKRIKQSITGNGNASKEQVASMLQQLFKHTEIPSQLDATDGLAAALCHFFQKNSKTGTVAGNIAAKQKGKPGNKKVYGGWESFIADNPKRVQAK